MRKLLWGMIVGAALAVCSEVSHADAVWVMTNSYHFDRSGNMNEQNPGLMYEHNGVVTGVYKNSYSKTTAFVGGVWRPVQIGDFQAGIVAGVGTGYDRPFGAAVVASYSFGKFAVQAVVVPVPKGVVTLQLGWSP